MFALDSNRVISLFLFKQNHTNLMVVNSFRSKKSYHMSIEKRKRKKQKE